MGLSHDFDQELQTLTLAGGPLPANIRVSNQRGVNLTAVVTSADTLGCAISEIEVFVPQLQSSTFDVLKEWAKQLSQRVTYMLEQIGPLEFDEQAGQVLIRSNKPDQLPDGAQYYEIVLSRHGAGNFLLKRYQFTKGQAGRQPVDMLLTRQVITKLIDDLEATIP
ncbi:MAG: hypothetical protein R3C18_24960 [Planctomycetaceae bacterium]